MAGTQVGANGNTIEQEPGEEVGGEGGRGQLRPREAGEGPRLVWALDSPLPDAPSHPTTHVHVPKA